MTLGKVAIGCAVVWLSMGRCFRKEMKLSKKVKVKPKKKVEKKARAKKSQQILKQRELESTR